MNDLLALLTALGAATIGGVFFGFSSFVMRALAQLAPAEGVAAMQRINVVVLNPYFLSVFMGTAALSVACMVLALLPDADAGAPWRLAAGALYLVGCFGVTMAFNVPRNNALAALARDTAEAHAHWPRYVAEWTRWNHVRTAAALAGAACAMVSLVR
jgi:uncharacterized membrane protein